MTSLKNPLTLPCGAVVPNRLVKAAMTEGLASIGGVPTSALERLYGIWSEGGAGVLITGNVVVDAYHLERPGNVVVDRVPDAVMKDALASWASAATAAGNHAWVQISHAGRQTLKTVNPHPKAPSAVKLGLPGGQFGEPVALTSEEISELVQRFAIAAKAMKDAGFTGVQIHGAHGYLISQFLSPRTNQRDDRYGGELENRARFLLEIVDATREAVGPEFPVAVKLNSADFQKGGFDFDDSLRVAKWLEEHSVDVIEISGGTYEQPKLLGMEGLEPEEQQHVAASTLRREAYFVDFALAMQKQVSIPLMVTGGFRSRAAMEQALEEGGASLIGLGRPLCVQTDGPARLLAGAESLPRYENELALLPSWLGFLKGISLIRTLSTFATTYWFYAQLDSLGQRGEVIADLSVFKAAIQVTKQQSSFLKAREKQG
ncbi:NADH:flavin oxidoreductase/NADH oxidase family protein [Congregibacter variabilis]|uniref:NADH:flavin oxidoreductase/NADH oxidase family protein n=1 Tax=Congregibacter variabilis TaxID=3081200 RepID=A0ABZ0I471_9GAMM|nr:NADH:flavin oxidoreductase/NADH oxidase family protein [Congregibacter sp. IMCC43200]